VGNTPEELSGIIGELLDVGVRGILALRGDQPKDGGAPANGSLRYAQDLIELIRRVEQRRSALLCAGKVAVGVAAYPTRHPESPTEAHDVEVLLAKQRSGADFAITQVFFHTEQYADLITRARRAGVTIPIIPGVMPLTSVRRLNRLSELTGVEPAPELLARLAGADTDAERRLIGVRATVDLANAALAAGAPGIHLYTFNEHACALEVLDKLALPRPARPASRLNAIARRHREMAS
jgi:methylenetetrahydrofolate reductase (NADPH)